MSLDLSANLRRLERTAGKRPEWLDDVDALDLLEQLDLGKVIRASADELNFSCPFPGHDHGDQKPSGYMNDGSKSKKLNTVWKCHGCGRAGNAITFVAEFQTVSRQQASTWLREHYAPGWRAPKGGSMAKEWELRQAQRQRELDEQIHAGDIKTIDWKVYQKFDVDWPSYGDPANGYRDEPAVRYMYDRGFTTADLTTWRIGYDDQGARITVPVCDPDGNLVGVKGRAWEAGRKPKYLILGDKPEKRPRYGFEPYEKSLVVFGIEKWGEVDRYVFVEGEIDVMSLWKMGIPAICTGSASMSAVQAQIIKDYCDEVVLFLDNDTAGSNAVWGYETKDGEHKPGIVEVLEPFVHVRISPWHRFDANDYLVKGRSGRVQRLIEQAQISWRWRGE